jgi:hypothetical protein
MKQITYLMLLVFKISLISVKDSWHKSALEAVEKMVDFREEIISEEVTLKERASTEEKTALTEEATTKETTDLTEEAASKKIDLKEKASLAKTDSPEIINLKEEAALEKTSLSVNKIDGVKEAVVENMNK